MAYVVPFCWLGGGGVEKKSAKPHFLPALFCTVHWSMENRGLLVTHENILKGSFHEFLKHYFCSIAFQTPRLPAISDTTGAYTLRISLFIYTNRILKEQFTYLAKYGS